MANNSSPAMRLAHLTVGQDARSFWEGLPAHLPDLGIHWRPQDDSVRPAGLPYLVRHPLNQLLFTESLNISFVNLTCHAVMQAGQGRSAKCPPCSRPISRTECMCLVAPATRDSYQPSLKRRDFQTWSCVTRRKGIPPSGRRSLLPPPGDLQG